VGAEPPDCEHSDHRQHEEITVGGEPEEAGDAMKLVRPETQPRDRGEQDYPVNTRHLIADHETCAWAAWNR
jgi:hypothetical protein